MIPWMALLKWAAPCASIEPDRQDKVQGLLLGMHLCLPWHAAMHELGRHGALSTVEASTACIAMSTELKWHGQWRRGRDIMLEGERVYLDCGSLLTLHLAEALLWHQLLGSTVQVQPGALPKAQHITDPATARQHLPNSFKGCWHQQCKVPVSKIDLQAWNTFVHAVGDTSAEWGV